MMFVDGKMMRIRQYTYIFIAALSVATAATALWRYHTDVCGQFQDDLSSIAAEQAQIAAAFIIQGRSGI